MKPEPLSDGDLCCFLQRLQTETAVLVRLESVRGSVPREAGAWMAVWPDGRTTGSIGGGHLEWHAIAVAQTCTQLLPGQVQRQTVALGPSLGQCCGGAVDVSWQTVRSAELGQWQHRLQRPGVPVAVFGAGHVGQALVRSLQPLPFAVRWFDSRDTLVNMPAPNGVLPEWSDPLHQAVPGLAAGSLVVVLTHSHAQDLEVIDACLHRQRVHGDLPFVGLIGSRTKWGVFQHRLQARGYSHAALAGVTCPIGLPGIVGKHPAVIAASVAAQLLQVTGNQRS